MKTSFLFQFISCVRKTKKKERKTLGTDLYFVEIVFIFSFLLKLLKQIKFRFCNKQSSILDTKIAKVFILALQKIF